MSNFGYSDDDFMDYCWFRNCIDHSWDSSDSGSSGEEYVPKGFGEKYGGRVALAVVVIAITIIAVEFATGGAISHMINGY